jgi:hypothetical protein
MERDAQRPNCWDEVGMAGQNYDGSRTETIQSLPQLGR